jgi:hypothetical protein
MRTRNPILGTILGLTSLLVVADSTSPALAMSSTEEAFVCSSEKFHCPSRLRAAVTPLAGVSFPFNAGGGLRAELGTGASPFVEMHALVGPTAKSANLEFSRHVSISGAVLAQWTFASLLSRRSDIICTLGGVTIPCPLNSTTVGRQWTFGLQGGVAFGSADFGKGSDSPNYRYALFPQAGLRFDAVNRSMLLPRLTLGIHAIYGALGGPDDQKRSFGVKGTILGNPMGWIEMGGDLGYGPPHGFWGRIWMGVPLEW